LASAPTDKVSKGLAPALPFSSIFRFQKEARDDTLGFITNWAELGGVARFESRLFIAYLVTAPEAVQHILQDNNKNYRREVEWDGVVPQQFHLCHRYIREWSCYQTIPCSSPVRAME
jgi:hypothetical protein